MRAVILDYKQTAESASVAARIEAILSDAGCEASICDGLPEERVDIAVVLGGDGAMIRAAKSAVASGVPVIGVNMGRVGYLAELEVADIARLADVVAGRYYVEPRMLLRVTAPDGMVHEALNDAVVANERGARIAALSLTCNGQQVGSYLADGLIFATPTGSTAYSMSAGGAVIDPALSCICVTPICSVLHRAKPMVFAESAVFVLENTTDAEEIVHLTIDGTTVCQLAHGQAVVVERSDAQAQILRLEQDGFYKALRRKTQHE